MNRGLALQSGLVEIWVLTCEGRKPITVEHLKKANVPHQVYCNQDWDEPPVPKPNRLIEHEIKHPQLKRYYGLGAYRCFRGHQEILQRVEGPYVLVLEDDVKPVEWAWTAVKRALMTLTQFQIASLHARDVVVANSQTIAGLNWQTAKTGRGRRFKFALGSQAYLTTRAIAGKIAELLWDKLPFDLVLYNKFHTGILQPTCFHHIAKESRIK